MSNDDLARKVMLGNALIAGSYDTHGTVASFDSTEIDSVRLGLLMDRVGEVSHAHVWGSGELEERLLRVGESVLEWLDDLIKAQAR